MIVINLFGAPSVGKSTTSAFLFYELKRRKINCELVTEKAKDLCWQEDDVGLRNQLYVAGEQIMRLDRLNGKVDVAITDAPLMLQTIYYEMNKCPLPEMFEQIILEFHNKYDNLNYKLKYDPELFESIGRIHRRDQAYVADLKINGILSKYGIKYKEIETKDTNLILNEILQYIEGGI